MTMLPKHTTETTYDMTAFSHADASSLVEAEIKMLNARQMPLIIVVGSAAFTALSHEAPWQQGYVEDLDPDVEYDGRYLGVPVYVRESSEWLVDICSVERVEA